MRNLWIINDNSCSKKKKRQDYEKDIFKAGIN